MDGGELGTGRFMHFDLQFAALNGMPEPEVKTLITKVKRKVYPLPESEDQQSIVDTKQYVCPNSYQALLSKHQQKMLSPNSGYKIELKVVSEQIRIIIFLDTIHRVRRITCLH